MTTMLQRWYRDGLMTDLSMHVAIVFAFFSVLSVVTIVYEEALYRMLEGASLTQAAITLLVVLFAYLAIEAGLLSLLVSGLVRTGALTSRKELRMWLAVIIVGGCILATILTPITIGGWGLVLPGIPELIVIIALPKMLRNG